MSPHTLLIKVHVEDAARNSFGVAVIQPLKFSQRIGRSAVLRTRAAATMAPIR